MQSRTSTTGHQSTSTTPLTFTDVALKHWTNFITAVCTQQRCAKPLGRGDLDIATVIAVSRYCASIDIDLEAVQRVSKSANIVSSSLDRGLIVYGVNTGFGGSADTRSSAVQEVQRTLIRGLHYGVLSRSATYQCALPVRSGAASNQSQVTLYRSMLPVDDPTSATIMPTSWVRASMLIRLSSLLGGASGVQSQTVKTLAVLLNQQIIPCVPLRGSISASGDLSPLSYISGAMQGEPSILVRVRDKASPAGSSVTRADRALAVAKIQPVELGPKEGLAIVNGTAVSTGVAALALHEAHCQAALCQVLTAMSVEALQGTTQSFRPFVSQVRPHPGQKDCSRAIFSFLSGSRLVRHNDGTEDMTLRQDRYSIRTAPQWIGPVLEDLLLADQQVTVEINSVTDNPLVDIESGSILHAGNFQAKSISSAMEKTRAALQTIGRMLFSQCTELINPTTNHGLPANLVVDDPSVSFIWKGTDVMIAALASELGFLASPVASHVQTAEMGNQALNSLALISARYTLTAADVLTQLSSAHLMALCQAFDLRAMHSTFVSEFRHEFAKLVSDANKTALDKDNKASLPDPEAETIEKMWAVFRRKLDLGMNMDARPRMQTATESLQPFLLSHWPTSVSAIFAIKKFSEECVEAGLERFEAVRSSYRKNPDATFLLGKAGKRMYSYVRNDLSVPFFGEAELSFEGFCKKGTDTTNMDNEWPTVGDYITRIYEAMRTGALYAEAFECFKDIQTDNDELDVRARL